MVPVSRQDEQYFADHASDGSERQRLGQMAQVYDPWTQDMLLKAGLTSGDSLAEIGFGTGSMLRWANTVVAPDGNVHGFDLTRRFLDTTTALDEPIELSEHDIQRDPLPGDNFDYIYTRLLLAHLHDPLLAIRNMISGLKPGGKLVALDYNSLVVRAESGQPEAEEFDHAVNTMNQRIGDEGLISAEYGAVMSGQMAACGLSDIEQEIMPRHHTGGDFGALLSAAGLDLLGQARPELAAQATVIANCMRQPGFRYRDADMHCVIGTWLEK